MINSLTALQKRLGYQFRDFALLELALTHPSYLQENPAAPESNQRLEFLGDAVLQLVLTEALYDLYPDEREGVLSLRRAALSKGPFLAMLAREIQLDDCLRLSTSEENTGGRKRPSALEDAFEALIAAIHLDGGLDASRQVLRSIYGELTVRLSGLEQTENPKGRLQEKIQPKYGNNTLRYEVSQVEGEAHARRYEVIVYFKDQALGSGNGTSKKQAEEAAARAALRRLEKTPLL